jgi:hypothetical protein
MLNKGKHILEAVKTLSTLLISEEKHHVKKRQIFKEFTKQSKFPESLTVASFAVKVLCIRNFLISVFDMYVII